MATTGRADLATVAGPSGSVTLTVDAANQLASDSDGAEFQYDEGGRLVEEAGADGAIRYFLYDSRGLLVSETVSDVCATATPTITGTAGDDAITGTKNDDIIFGLGGNDIIDGGSCRHNS